MVSLGTLPGDTSSAAMSLSADGSTILGVSRGPAGTRWFLWTPSLGMVDLSTLVVLPTGWSEVGARAISADAQTIVGSGRHCGHTEGWIADLSDPPWP
jgi:hypothetical protein